MNRINKYKNIIVAKRRLRNPWKRKKKKRSIFIELFLKEFESNLFTSEMNKLSIDSIDSLEMPKSFSPK